MKVSAICATAALLAAPAAAELRGSFKVFEHRAAERELRSEDDGQTMSKSSKALSFSLSMPSKSGKGAKGSKADLSFSLSMPSKSGKGSKAEAIEGGKAAKADLSFSLSMPSKSGKSADAIEGGKASKADLSFSFSLPSKSAKAAAFPDYCDQPFCYIDPDNCDDPEKMKSGYFPALTYSYATCSAKSSKASKPDGCPCIDSAAILEQSITDGTTIACDFNGAPGALTAGENGICLPTTYGSDVCDLHSLDEPECAGFPLPVAKASKADLSFSLSLPSKSAKADAIEGGKASKADLSFSLSLPSKSAKAANLEGKASKADLSFSLSMPSKSGKGAKSDLSFSVSSKAAKAVA